MKAFVSACGLCVLGLLLIFSITGCAGLNSGAMAISTPTPAAHGTFVFVNGFNSPTQPTDGYRLNPDGTLTPIPGSPFPITGQLAASGRFLMVANPAGLNSYRVDPATGVPTAAGSTVIPSPNTIGADARNVYVAGASDAVGTFIYGFSVADSGALTPVPGSPVISGAPCVECPMPLFPNLALNNNFLALSVWGFHGSGGIAVYPRESNGALGQGQGVGFENQSSVALQPPAGSVAFSLVPSVNSYRLEASGKPTPAMSFDIAGIAMDETVDATGKFLLVLDRAGTVHVFTIDSATAGLSEIGISEPAGDGANLIVMDPSGHFVIVAQASNQAIPAPPDQITVFTFDPASGAMKKRQSYPVGKLPARTAIVAE